MGAYKGTINHNAVTWSQMIFSAMLTNGFFLSHRYENIPGED